MSSLPPPPSADLPRGTAREVWGAFLKLGLTSFGGPVAHLAYFREAFVARRRWLDDVAYAELVALCQFLPGPASSQLAFALGMRRAGVAGAIAASAAFTLPSTLLMVAFGYGVLRLTHLHSAPWVHGLKLAAVAVVAQAVWVMGRSLCPDLPRLAVCLGAAAVLMARPAAWTQPAVIAAGAAVGWLLYRRLPAPVAAEPVRAHRGASNAALALFTLLLLTSPLLARAIGTPAAAHGDAFYRAGALVFGGGHVVLPLLREEVVPRGWVTDDQFLAGYAAAQAMPGPLFSFAAYLGTIAHGGPAAWIGGLYCTVAVFLPAWLLIGGALPHWRWLQARPGVSAAVRGANAAVVGVLLAALCTPVITEGIHSPADACLAAAGFACLQWLRCPSWAVVAATAAATTLLRM